MGLIDFSLGDIGSVFKDIREAITGEAISDPDKMAAIDLKLKQLEQAANQGQISINIEEAKSSSVFVAGWRPFIGWVGGFALAYSFIIQPTIIWAAEISGKTDLSAPSLQTGVLMNLVLAMLGFGGLRTFEKYKGINKKH